MRKLLLSILSLFAFAIASNAADIVFDMSDPNAYVAESNKVTYSTTASTAVKYASGTVFTNAPITITTTSTDANNGIAAFTQSESKNKAIQIRGYVDSKLVFKTTDGSVITKIAISGSSINTTYLKADVGAIANSAWTGSSNKVEISIIKSTIQINTITVTTASADAITAPTFSVAEGTYYEAQTVTITNPNSSGKVYYTTNGDDPTAESTEYTRPIEITATTTLKAVVIDGEKKSDITSATYTIAAPVEVANIADYLTKDDLAAVKFTNPVTAVYQSGSYLYVKDDSGVALIYGSVGQTYANGDVIPAGFSGVKKYYNGIIELDVNAFGSDSFKASAENTGAIAAAEKKLADITAANVHQYVFLKGVTYDATNKKFTDAADKELALAVYKRFSALPTTDGEYDVYGFITVYQKTIQIYPTEFAVASVAEFKDLDVGGVAKFTCPLTVVAVHKTTNNVNYYVQDESGDGIVIYGAIDDLPTYEAKDIIPAGFTGTYAKYNGLPGITNCTDLAEATEQGTIVAADISLEEIGTDAICSVVELQRAEILDIDGSNFNIKDETATVAAYNKFGLKKIEAYTGLKIVGIVDVYNGKIQILPIEIDYSNGTAEEAEISDEDDVVITTGEGSIIVEGGDEIQVVTPDGRATTVKGSGDTPDRRRRIIETENGIYIVVVDGEVVEKVYVE